MKTRTEIVFRQHTGNACFKSLILKINGDNSKKFLIFSPMFYESDKVLYMPHSKDSLFRLYLQQENNKWNESAFFRFCM